jgi:hypothetical protein
VLSSLLPFLFYGHEKENARSNFMCCHSLNDGKPKAPQIKGFANASVSILRDDKQL